MAQARRQGRRARCSATIWCTKTVRRARGRQVGTRAGRGSRSSRGASRRRWAWPIARALWRKVGGFNEAWCEEDTDLWRRMLRAGAEFDFLPLKSGRCHLRPDSFSRTRPITRRQRGFFLENWRRGRPIYGDCDRKSEISSLELPGSPHPHSFPEGEGTKESGVRLAALRLGLHQRGGDGHLGRPGGLGAVGLRVPGLLRFADGRLGRGLGRRGPRPARRPLRWSATPESARTRGG